MRVIEADGESVIVLTAGKWVEHLPGCARRIRGDFHQPRNAVVHVTRGEVAGQIVGLRVVVIEEQFAAGNLEPVEHAR